MKITDIRPHLLSSPYGDGSVFGQPLGVKTLGLVEVHTDVGIVGFGESYCAIYVPELFVSIINYLRPLLIGSSFSDPRQIFRNTFIPFVSRNGLVASCYSAIDIALWQITCSVNQCNLLEFVDKSRCYPHSLPVYFSGGSAVFTPDQLLHELDLLSNINFAGYKMRIGRRDWSYDQQRILSVRNNFSGHLMLDSIGGTLFPPTIQEWATRSSFLHSINPYWLEEPTTPDAISTIDLLKNDLNLPLASGEAITGISELLYYCTLNSLDILQIDCTHIGGISPILLSLPQLLASNKRFATHVWGTPIAYSANLQIAHLLRADFHEYPGVSLDLNQHLCPDFYAQRPPDNEYLNSPIHNIDITSVVCDPMYTYVPNSGFSAA